MPNLVILHLRGNQITSIKGLSELVHLTELSLFNNQIKSIEGLKSLI